MTATTPSANTCAFAWCENTWAGHREHAWHDRASGTSVNRSAPREVSVWTSVGDEYVEPIMVSVEDRDNDGKCGEAWLSLQAAIGLRDALAMAIEHAQEWAQR